MEYWYIKLEGIGNTSWAMEEECRCVLLTRGEMERVWDGQIGLQGRRFKLWWSVNQDGYCRAGVVVKEELCDKVVEVRRVNDRVMYFAVVFEDVVGVVCAYAPQSVKSMEEKDKFYEDLSRERTTHHMSELINGMRDISGHVERNLWISEVHGGHSTGKRNQEGRMLMESCDAKHICISNGWLRKTDKKKMTYGSGYN